MQQADRQLFKFALIICISCSVLLSFAAASLRGIQEQKVELDRKINVLKAFGVQVADEKGKRIPAEEVYGIFSNHISEVIIEADSGEVREGASSSTVDRKEVAAKKLLPLYLWKEDGEVQKYAFPISGKGLWSTIYGFMALEKDLASIVGVTFYKHGETPGLGGEVEQSWYQSQFEEGKKMMDNGEVVPMRSIKGGVASRYPDGNPHAIDGISGATITGDGVARFITEDFKRYNSYFKTIRDS